jgi:hypothetical protein
MATKWLLNKVESDLLKTIKRYERKQAKAAIIV